MTMINVSYLQGYPADGKHLKLDLDQNLPCTISKGEDSFEYTTEKGEKKFSVKHLWYVHFDDLAYLIPTKGFKTPENAVQYAATSFTKLLVKALKEMDHYDKVTISKFTHNA